MELLAPAGNLEKLKYVYHYGADAAYLGLGRFSLRALADKFTAEDAPAVVRLKGHRKLYAAVNIFFHNADIARLEQELDLYRAFPFDGFILSDLGILRLLQKHFPQAEMHLSTQANCLNAEAAKLYRDLGFQRLILARETALADIEAIKKAVPDTEIEVFVHGAMCLAYSGRCFLSRQFSGKKRSANQGECSHTCRWKFRVLEEEKRPGVYLPVEEGENFTTILSSKDLAMIDHITDLKNAGVDSLKIEGRMKSIYYAALVTRAYRAAVDRAEGKPVPCFDEFRRELWNVSHREFTTGFFFDAEGMNEPNLQDYEKQYTFAASIGAYAGDGEFELEVRNTIDCGEVLEFVGPDTPAFADDTYVILNQDRLVPASAHHMYKYTIKSARPLATGMLVRRKPRPGEAGD